MPSLRLDRSRRRLLYKHGAILTLIICFGFGPGSFIQSSEPQSWMPISSEAKSLEGAGDSAIQIDHLPVKKVEFKIPDLSLLNEKGNKVHFYSDLLKGKVVVLGFFYTHCSFVCDIQGKVFVELQKRLGDRLSKEVFLILATRDPQTDTPQVLRKWGARYKAKPGWVFLTGSVHEINKLLLPLTGDRAGRVEMHSAIIYIGNDRTGDWYVSRGTSDPDVLIKAIDIIARGN